MALKEQPLSRFPRFFRLTPPEERPREYFVLDFETTGLDPQLDVITEIAVLRVFDRQAAGMYRTAVAAERIVGGVRPGSKPSTVLVGDGVSLEQAANEMGRFFEGKNLPIFAHNARFDARLLFCKGLADFLPPECPIADSIELAKRAFPNEPSYALDSLADSLGLKRFAAHHADGDVLCTAQLIEACYAKLGSPAQTVVQTELALGLQERPCHKCGSPLVCKDGFTQAGSQVYRCKSCGKKFSDKSAKKSGDALDNARNTSARENGKRCRHCGSAALVVKEHRGASTRFRCKDCGKTTSLNKGFLKDN